MVVVGSSATVAGGGSAISTATDCCGGWTKTNRTALPLGSQFSSRGRGGGWSQQGDCWAELWLTDRLVAGGGLSALLGLASLALDWWEGAP